MTSLRRMFGWQCVSGYFSVILKHRCVGERRTWKVRLATTRVMERHRVVWALTRTLYGVRERVPSEVTHHAGVTWCRTRRPRTKCQLHQNPQRGKVRRTHRLTRTFLARWCRSCFRGRGRENILFAPSGDGFPVTEVDHHSRRKLKKDVTVAFFSKICSN